MSGKPSRFGRLSSIFSSTSHSLDEESTKKVHQSVPELEKQVEELTSKCGALEVKLKRDQNKCLEWKKTMIQTILQKHEPSNPTNTSGRKGTNNLLTHRKYASEHNLLDSGQSGMYYDFDNSHPLLDEKIAQHLLQFLKKEDLYRARLVCAIWNHVGKLEIARRIDAHIHLDNIQNLHKFQQIQQFRGKGPAFYERFHFHHNLRAAHHPEQRRNSQAVAMELCPSENVVEFHKILHIVGGYAKKLALAYVDNKIFDIVLKTCPALDTLILIIGMPLLASFQDHKHLAQFPGLKTLTLTLQSTKDHRVSEKHEQNFLQIFKLLLSSSHVTLAKLALTVHGGFADNEVHFANEIAHILLKAHPVALHELDFSSLPIDKKTICEILSAGFKFATLGVGFVDWKVANEMLPALYRTKSIIAQLRKVTIHVHSKFDGPNDTALDELIANGFSYLRHLTTFDVIPSKFLVEGKYRFQKLHRIQSHYLVNPIVGIPVLKWIEVEPHHVFKTIKHDSTPSSTPSPELQHRVNRLRFVQTLIMKREPAACDTIRKCVKLLSNSLTRLEFVPSDASTLIAVWNGLPNLEELRIHPTDSIPDLEAVIIGMSSLDCRRLREDPTIAYLIGMTEGKTLKHLQSSSSIRQLKKLRSFDAGTEKYLSDLAVLLCFVKMRTLTALKFRFKGSYSSIRLLKSEIPGIYVDTWK